MKLYHFREFFFFLPKIFEQPIGKVCDPLWTFSSAVDEFNYIREHNITSSGIKVLDWALSLNLMLPSFWCDGKFGNTESYESNAGSKRL